MSTEEIASAVAEILIDHLMLGKPPEPTDRLIADLGCDSLDAMELLLTIEEEFEIEIEDGVAEKLTTVQEIVEYLATATSEKVA